MIYQPVRRDVGHNTKTTAHSAPRGRTHIYNITRVLQQELRAGSSACKISPPARMFKNNFHRKRGCYISATSHSARTCSTTWF